MKKVNLEVNYISFEDPSDLSAEDSNLLDIAEQAIINAYAPYSGYRVGSAVLLENGEVLAGNNQENVAYPAGLCAERVALFYAASQFPDSAVQSIAITAKASGFQINEPVTPCGSCRQVLAETENRFRNKIRVIMRGETGPVFITEGISNLLPLLFHAEELKK